MRFITALLALGTFAKWNPTRSSKEGRNRLRFLPKDDLSAPVLLVNVSSAYDLLTLDKVNTGNRRVTSWYLSFGALYSATLLDSLSENSASMSKCSVPGQKRWYELHTLTHISAPHLQHDPSHSVREF